MKSTIDTASVDELKQGFTQTAEDNTFVCLFCGAKYSDGVIYKHENNLVDAKKAMFLHIQEHHNGVFSALLEAGKKQTGLTDTQKNILLYVHNGLSDKEIVEKTENAPSTVRFQRYNFREKVKQARFILALSELLEEQTRNNFAINDKNGENDPALETFFESVSPLVLKTFAVKKKNQLFILKTIAKQFEHNKTYTGQQVNDLLKPIYNDHVSIRRALIDNGFMERTPDGGEYWLKTTAYI